MKKNKALIFAAGLLLVSSCTVTNVPVKSRIERYPGIYQEKPLSILIMPPINNTVNVEAKEYFYTSLAMPLAERGYYVISPFLAMDFLKAESAYDSDLFIDKDLSLFRSILGADVALFTKIDRWEKSSWNATLTVDIEYILKSTHSNEVLFTRKGTLVLDKSDEEGSSNLMEALVRGIVSAISTALTDKVEAARRCNTAVLEDLPCGCYSPQYGQDKDIITGPQVFTRTVKE